MRAPPNGSGTEHHHNVHIRSLISLFQAREKENECSQSLFRQEKSVNPKPHTSAHVHVSRKAVTIISREAVTIKQK